MVPCSGRISAADASKQSNMQYTWRSPSSVEQQRSLTPIVSVAVNADGAASEMCGSGARDTHHKQQQCLEGKEQRQHAPASVCGRKRGRSVGCGVLAEWQLQTAMGAERGCLNAVNTGVDAPKSVLSPWIR